MGHCFLLAVFCCLPLLAQPKAAPPAQEQFRIQVREVIVPVTVTDVKGRFVSDLDPKDFRIFDEGKEQRSSSSRANGISRWSWAFCWT